MGKNKSKVFNVASALVVLLFHIGTAHAAQRFALVIGNERYESSPPLQNPVNDANAMAEKLKGLGFELVGGKAATNIGLVQMNRLVRELAQSANANDTVLFYFAGHGIAGSGDNYLIPVDDAGIAVREDVPDHALSLQRILGQLGERGGGTNIVVLDACRNNPLPDRSRSSGSTQGLTRIAAPLGTLIAYAADEGQAAMDGTGANGVFTSALLDVISVPGLRIDDALAEVTRRVREISNGQQIPVRESNLETVLYLIPPQRQGSNAELAQWDRIRDQPTPENVRGYLQAYPQGQFAELAKLMLQAPAPEQPQQPLDIGTVDFDRLNHSHRQMRVPDDVRPLLNPSLVAKLESDPFFNFPFETRALDYERTDEVELDLSKLGGDVSTIQSESGAKLIADGLPGVLRVTHRIEAENDAMTMESVVGMGGLLELLSVTQALRGPGATSALLDIQASGSVFPLATGAYFVMLATSEYRSTFDGVVSHSRERVDCRVGQKRLYGLDFPAPGHGYTLRCESRELVDMDQEKIYPEKEEFIFIAEIGQFLNAGNSYESPSSQNDSQLASAITADDIKGGQHGDKSSNFVKSIERCNAQLEWLHPDAVAAYETCSTALFAER